MEKYRKPAVCAVCAAAGVLIAVFAIRGGKPPAASIEAAGTESAAPKTASIEAAGTENAAQQTASIEAVGTENAAQQTASIEAVGFFARYSEESFNAGEYAAENGAEALMALFDSLREYVDANGLTDEEVRVLLTNISGLDGAYTEAYGAILRAARNSDPDGFDAAVNALDEARRQELLPLLD